MANPTKMPSSSYHSEHYIADDEIDLLDLFLIIWRWKWAVLSIFILVLAGAGIYLTYAVPVYESKSRLMIGQVSEVGLLEDGEKLSARVEHLNKNMSSGSASLSSAQLERGSENIFEIIVQGENPSEVFELTRKISSQILRDHEKNFESLINPLNQKLRFVDTQTVAVKELLSNFDDTQKSYSAPKSTLAILEKSRLMTELAFLEEQKMDFAIRLNPVNTYPTFFLSEPGYPETPVSPKPKLVMALSVVLGLMLGLFSAFIFEFIRNARQRIRSADK
jgi:uncharacterized protein involved in exopolysaccharide biosynthesis